MDPNLCDTCWHFDYDEEYDEYYCMMDLDEDEVYRIFSSRQSRCAPAPPPRAGSPLPRSPTKTPRLQPS